MSPWMKQIGHGDASRHFFRSTGRYRAEAEPYCAAVHHQNYSSPVQYVLVQVTALQNVCQHYNNT